MCLMCYVSLLFTPLGRSQQPALAVPISLLSHPGSKTHKGEMQGSDSSAMCCMRSPSCMGAGTCSCPGWLMYTQHRSSQGSR
jgi:hypothetical protein